MNELVSIISPCYNGERHLNYFLESILNQTYSNIELIMVDDGSTDDSANIILGYKKRFRDKGFSLIYLYKKNGGQASAINVGLRNIHGEYLMWMDSDDVLYPQSIERKVDYLMKHSDCGFVLCKGEEVYEDNLDKAIRVIGRKPDTNKDDLFSDLIFCYNVVFCPATIFVRMEAFVKAIPSKQIYENKEGQNWQLMLPLAYTTKWGYIDEVLFKYVVRDNSHSHITKSYDRNMERQEGFRKILCTTVRNIESMPPCEKIYWLRQINIKCWKEKLLYALQENDITSQIMISFRLLAILAKIEKSYNPVYYYMRKLIRKLKNK